VPLAATPTGEDVWAANPHTGLVQEIGATGTLQAPFFGGAPNGIALDPSRRVWITGTADGVTVFTGSAKTAVTAGAGPSGVVICGQDAWIADSGAHAVSMIGLSTLRAVRTVDVGATPRALACGFRRVWVGTDDGAVLDIRLDGSIKRRLSAALPGRPTSAAAPADGGWFTSSTGAGPGALTRVDPRNGDRVATRAEPNVGTDPVAVTVDTARGHAIWVLSAADRVLTELGTSGTSDGKPVRRLQIGTRPQSVTVGSSFAWVEDPVSGKLFRIPLGTR
jgi:hypothetical protein